MPQSGDVRHDPLVDVVLLVPVHLATQAVQARPAQLLAGHAPAPPLISDGSSLHTPRIVIQTMNSPEQNMPGRDHQCFTPSVCKQAELHGLNAVENFSLELDAVFGCFLSPIKKPQLAVAVILI